MKNLDKLISYIICFCGVGVNFAGLVASFLVKDNIETITLTSISLLILIICSTICWIKEQYSFCNLILSILIVSIMFPLMFIFNGGVNGAFIYYFYLSPVVFGIIIRKKWQIVFPIITLIIDNIVIYLSFKYPAIIKIADTTSIMLQTVMGFNLSSLFILIFCLIVTYILLVYIKKLNLVMMKYQTMSYKDELTGVYNRRYLDEKLKSREFKYGIMIDIDNFKQVNDKLGHQKGDETLQELAKLLLKYCSDEFKLYRYGGEEFYILTRYNYDKLIELFESIYKDINLNLDITISAGMSENKWDIFIEDIVKESDNNLYMAKHNGKNCLYFKEQRII